MKKRNETLDILKGVAILAVIFGHAVQRGLIYDFTSTISWKVIYSFHMPLFVLLSGFTLCLSKSIYNYAWLKKKFNRLIIPLMSWTILVELMRNFQFTGLKPFTNFPNTVYGFVKLSIASPGWAFWFLWTIFVFMLIFYALNKITEKYKRLQKIQIILLISIEIIIFVLPQRYFGLGKIFYYFPMFVSGYYLSKYRDYISKYFKYFKYVLLPSAMLWILFLNIWDDRNGMIYKYLIAVVSMTTVYCLVKLFENHLTWLTYFGKRSLELYMCESIFLNIGIGSDYIRVISIFITAIICSLLFARILKTNKFTSFIAFGSYKSENKFKIKKIVKTQ